MKPARILATILATAALTFAFICASPGRADDDEDDGPHRRGPAGTPCFDVRATISVRFATDACDSVVGLCTRGTVRSRGAGFLRGTTRFRATGLGGGVVGEASIVTPPAEPPTTWAYSGELSIATALGTLELEDAGVFDTARGTFTELNRAVGGTGVFRGATGDLFIFGYAHDDFGGFDGTIRGDLCVSRRW